MSAITISRQTGCQGDELARLVAQRLGWQLMSRDLINQAALGVGMPHLALAAIDELGLLNLRPSSREWQVYQHEVERIIHEWADIGHIVIIGRGGQMALRGRSDVLHVCVVAPLEMRVAQLQQEKNIPAHLALARLEASDKSRVNYMKRSYRVHPDDPALYHLIINTGLLGLPQAVEGVIQVFLGWSCRPERE